MKQTIKLFILTILLITYSCSNEDDSTQTNTISLQDLEVTIDENPSNGLVLGNVVANQSVGGATLTYTIDSQTPNGAIAINSSTGELTVFDASIFDYEINQTISATISASGTTNTALVTINLNNIVELSVQNFTESVDENPINGVSIGSIQATGDGSLSYSILNQTPTGALSIDANTGEITVADATLFDFETNPIITADGMVDNNGTTEMLIVTITLNNVNELSVQDFTITMAENPSNGDTIGTVQAVGDGTLSYSINSQTPNNAITINTNTGELTVADATLFDFEANATITATIQVDNSTNSESLSVTINLSNVNEVGDIANGGIIFWLDPTDNSHGLVFAYDSVYLGCF